MGCFDQLVVATDSDEVARVCQGFGAPVVMTSAEHPSGTDRVAEVAGRAEFLEYDIIANLQGDEPLLDESTVEAAIAQVRDAGRGIGTCAVSIRDAAELSDPSVVKVACSEDGRALYFSRSEVPYARDPGVRDQELSTGGYLRHVGLYVYSRSALEQWVQLPQGRLEQLERLEQLRPLAAGTTIGVAVVEHAEGGVDTLVDVLRIEAKLAEAGHTLAVETPAQ